MNKSSLNKVILIGRLGKDVEYRELGNGSVVASTSLATAYSKKKGDAYEDVTSWHNIIAWGSIATFMKNYVKKGDQISIVGRIDYRKWTDKEGKNRTTTDIVAEELTILQSKREGKPEQPDKNQANQSNDDLPF